MPVIVILWSFVIGFGSALGAQVCADRIHDAREKREQAAEVQQHQADPNAPAAPSAAPK